MPYDREFDGPVEKRGILDVMIEKVFEIGAGLYYGARMLRDAALKDDVKGIMREQMRRSARWKPDIKVTKPGAREPIITPTPLQLSEPIHHVGDSEYTIE